MKKQFLFLLSVVTLLLTSCENYSTSNSQPTSPSNRGEPRQENPGQPGGPGYQDSSRNNPQGR